MTGQRWMPGWVRAARGAWRRKFYPYHAHVVPGRGGWFWAIFDANGDLVLQSTRPTRRSRKARRLCQRQLLRLAAPRPEPEGIDG